MSENQFTENRRFGYTKPERIEEIRSKVGASNQLHAIVYEGRLQNLKVIRVNIGLLVYRIENFRTASLQKKYIAEHSAQIDDQFFRLNPDSIQTQRIQHSLLKELIRDKGLFDSFEKENETGQTEPLIISDEGVVVNGNRRLCAWRELYYGPESRKYASFQTVDVAVLPDHDPDAIVELEMNLQVKPDMKAEYAWHAKAISYKSELERTGLLAPELEKKYGLSSGTVQKTIDMYNLADEYLIRIGKKDIWTEVDNEEFAFKEILDRSKKRGSEDDAFVSSLFQEVCFDVITANREGRLTEGSGRVYGIISDLDKYFPDIVDHLKTDVIPKKYDEMAQQAASFSNGQIQDSAVVLKAVQSSDAALIANAAIREARARKEIEKEAKGQRFIISQVRKALDALGTCVTTEKYGQMADGISEMLETIESNVRALRQWLSDADNN